MKIFLTAKPKSKKAYVKKIDKENYIVSVTQPPVEDKANMAIERALADHFKIPSSQVRIISGQNSRKKVVEIF